VAVECQDKKTFTCHEGTYKYIRLPFGLTNAAATFQRAIDMILPGVKWKTCLVYFDDVIVVGETPLTGETRPPGMSRGRGVSSHATPP